jgi:hypothetical protein
MLPDRFTVIPICRLDLHKPRHFVALESALHACAT